MKPCLSISFVLLLATSLIAAPAVLILALGVLLTLTYYEQFRGAPELLTLPSSPQRYARDRA